MGLKGRGFKPRRSSRPSVAALAAGVSIDEQRREVDISVTLCMSPCSSDYIFSNKLFVGIWHIVSEDFSRDLVPLTFPADYLHPAHCHLVSSSVGYSDLPAYSQILLRLANTNLRTVIVTAAVHWGFSSKLRLAADLSL